MTSTEDVLNEIEENSLQIISAAKKVAKIFSFIPFDVCKTTEDIFLDYTMDDIVITLWIQKTCVRISWWQKGLTTAEVSHTELINVE
jgi:hypothetical protein